MNKALLLGNGISRLLFHDLIYDWDGEIWACNYAFREWGPLLNRLTGHHHVLIDAAEIRISHGHTYDIYTGQFGGFKNDYDFVKKFTCPGEFRKDSGTTMVAQALHEGYEVYCCGFDFGGRDIYTVRLQTQNKTNWIKRWRAIGERYGWDRIHFIGYDHMDFLTGPRSKYNEKEYYKRYILGKPHVPDPMYISLFNALYGTKEVYDMGMDELVQFKYGPDANKPGWVTTYKYEVAIKLEEKGEGEILETPDEEDIIRGEVEDLDELSKDALLKIAQLRGLDVSSRTKKADIIEMLAEVIEEDEEE